LRSAQTEETQNNNVLSHALAGIRDNAAAHQAARKSPGKVYGGVKSKIAGNMKSIRKSQVRETVKKVSSA
jgi:hypothetical protein